jgi:DNA invertase Pin-like site-specific DNA recombinase
MRPTDSLINRKLVFGAGDKITSRHLDLLGELYVRQSSNEQLRDNRESTERQYALTDRLKMLGWTEENIVVIDDDLGRSGSGSEHREGFQRMLSDITAERVGIVIGLEMSRLARNSKDWHDLFEVCAIFGTLIADEDGVYDPQIPNDRLILGMKGIISEMELHTMRIRLERGRMNKAQRGEMFHSAPVGYVMNVHGVVEKDPDERAQSAVQLIFDKFDELGSCHAVFHYFVREHIELPLHDYYGKILWRLPGKTTLDGILRHPLYAGAYGYGRRKSYKNKRHPDKRTKKHLPLEQWKVLIPDKYPAYITWDQFLQNQRKLRQNCSRKNQGGPPREGSALLAGILFCGHCGRRLQPHYQTKSGRPGYHCSRHLTMAVPHACQGVIQCDVIDDLVSRRVVEALQPAALELSLKVVEDESLRRKEFAKRQRQQLEHARYQAQLAERRYHAVDPDNRLVARTLEKQWEDSLSALQRAEEEHEGQMKDKPVSLSESERTQLMAMSADITGLWQASATTNKDRKQVVRCVIDKVIAAVQGTTEFVDVTIHWAGGFTSQHQITRRVSKYTQLHDYDVWAQRLIDLRRQGKRSPEIAEILNREGYRMARQQREFTATMVQQLISQPRFRDPLHNPQLAPHEWRLEDLAKALGMPPKKLRHWVFKRWVQAIQRPFAGTWVIRADDNELERLRELLHRPAQNRPFPLQLRMPPRLDGQ